tara:strand:- start:3841 stop:3996 length:156 start_codon:yes stop_codon:yes gene_type:complete
MLRKFPDLARDNKINFVNSANAYADSASETMFGNLIKKDWTAWIRATKIKR